MRYIQTDRLEAGQILGTDIIADDGRLILRQGVELSARLIEGLRRMQIAGVYVADVRFKHLKMSEGLGSRFRSEAVAKLKSTFEEIAKTGNFSSRPLVDLSKEVVAEVSATADFAIQLQDVRLKHQALLSHSISVCLLAVLTAKGMRYNMEQMMIIAIGSLLHDIGYASPQLKNPIKDHSKQGFDLIRGHQELPLLSAHIALQHHERLDGAGFPYGMKGEDVREYAQICAIANDFDNYINEPGTKRLPHEGIEYVMSRVGSCYSLAVVRAFVSQVAPYPVGTMVKLTNGQIGVVSENHPSNLCRPRIMLPEHAGYVALMEQHTIFVDEVVSAWDLIRT